MSVSFGQLFVPVGAVDPGWTCFCGRMDLPANFAGFARVTSATTTSPAGTKVTELTITPLDPTQAAAPVAMGYYQTGPLASRVVRIDGEIGDNETRVAAVSTIANGAVSEHRIKFL